MIATVATVTGDPGDRGAAADGARRSVGRWLADHLVLVVGILVLLYMFVPIGYIFALSFNQPSGRSATAQFESLHLEQLDDASASPTGCASRSGSASRSA